MNSKLSLLRAGIFLATLETGIGQPTLQFTASTCTVAENAGAVTLMVRRTGDANTVVTVDYATADGTASYGLDYIATNGILTFLPGETNSALSVPILNDGLVESGLFETFTVTLSNATGGAVLGTPATATVRIIENDTALQFEFGSYTFGSYRVGEAEGFIMLAVIRGDDGDFPVSVDFSTSNGTAVNAADYTATNGTLTVAAGQKVAVLTVPILNDGLKEANETFRVTLSNPTNQILGSQKIATVTIMDNDAGVQFQPAYKRRVAENEGAIALTVVRGNDTNLVPFTVDYATSDFTATNGLDYMATNGTLSFAQGEMVKTLTVPIRYDELSEADEQFKATLSNPTGGAVLGPYATATVEILDTTNTPPHHFANIAVQPDRSVQLTLGGSVDGHYREYFDLYPIEVSSNLVDWTPLVTLLRTNSSTNALVYTDTQATNCATRFYRTPTNYWITPYPGPTGPFPVGVVHRLLTDSSRRNRYWLSTNCAFMVSVWYPALAEAGKLPDPLLDFQIAQDPNWMTPFGATDTFITARLPYFKSAALPDVPCAAEHAPHPIAFFSPGATVVRSCAVLGAELASHGYVVVSVDHYDVTRTVFPDGTYLQGDTGVGAVIKADRARDLAFIADELQRWNNSDPLFAGRLDLTKLAAMGGSRGGGSAAQFAAADPRCKVLVAFDAGDDEAGISLHQPVLTIRADGSFDTTLYNLTTNHAVWFQISGATHGMVAASDWRWAFFPGEEVSSREAGQIINAYTLWHLNKYLRGSTEPMPALADYPRIINFKEK